MVSSNRGTNIKTYFRVIYITICAIGLLYQTSHLVSEYSSGNTFVENRVERLKRTKLPAITICLPFMISFDRFTKTFPQYRELYEEHKNLIVESKIWTKECENKLLDVFNQFKSAYFKQNLTIGDIFDSISIDKLNFTNISIRGLDDHGHSVSIDTIETIRSLVVEPYPRMCFTLFSEMSDNTSLVNSSQSLSHFRQFSLAIHHNNDNHFFHYFTKRNPYYLTLHSPNMMPDFHELDTFYPVELGYDNLVKYSEVHTELLPAPFVTDCKSYSVQNGSQSDMRSDCITGCVWRGLRDICHINCINWLNNSKLLREESDYHSNRICSSLTAEERSCIEANMVTLELVCEDQCPSNCHHVYYDFEVIRHTQYYRMTKPWDVLSLSFVHRDGPDMVIRHMPTMKWIELVSSFGGLSGMWLGISFVLILDHIVKAVIKFNDSKRDKSQLSSKI